MEFVPVSEAAARHGKSERTVWRWIKEAKVTTQTVGGRVLVGCDNTDRMRDTIEQLSTVTSEQVVLRDREFDSHGRLLSVVESLNVTLRGELRASRLSSRALSVFAFVLLVVMGVGVYFHTTLLAKSDAGRIADRAEFTLLTSQADDQAARLLDTVEMLTSELERSEAARQEAERQAEAQKAFGELLAKVFPPGE